MAKKEYRFAKKEKLRDHPFAKYIREVPKKVMVNVKRVKPETKTVMVNVERVKPKTKKVNVKIEKAKGRWANKKPKTH